MGRWEYVEGIRVVLREDGTALLRRLDGQDFDFEDGWCLSGTGTWQLTDDDGGQVVRLALKARIRVESRSPVTAADASTPEPPSTYAWSFYADRDQYRAKTTIDRTFAPDAVRKLKAEADHDLTVDGQDEPVTVSRLRAAHLWAGRFARRVRKCALRYQPY
ncbi:hypothetical protein ACNPQM_40385 [Streptomyces sp. NPDC056231]|uniref:hypothetical protein n=1 Tax=Streptomyces sp. NPDC056231 TaxID=3345755 RepID=UPI003AB06C17